MRMLIDYFESGLSTPQGPSFSYLWLIRTNLDIYSFALGIQRAPDNPSKYYQDGWEERHHNSTASHGHHGFPCVGSLTTAKK